MNASKWTSVAQPRVIPIQSGRVAGSVPLVLVDAVNPLVEGVLGKKVVLLLPLDALTVLVDPKPEISPVEDALAADGKSCSSWL